MFGVWGVIGKFRVRGFKQELSRVVAESTSCFETLIRFRV